GGEGFGVSLLQLLDEGLHVGRDYFFRGLLLVGVGGGLVDGCGGDVHGCFLLGLLHWPLPLNRAAACTYMPDASWRRRGVASARGGGSLILGTKRSGSGRDGAKRRAAQAQRGSLGKPLAGARGGAPLRSFCGCSCFSEHQGRRCVQEQAR